jgi:hypothetical protein
MGIQILHAGSGGGVLVYQWIGRHGTRVGTHAISDIWANNVLRYCERYGWIEDPALLLVLLSKVAIAPRTPFGAQIPVIGARIAALARSSSGPGGAPMIPATWRLNYRSSTGRQRGAPLKISTSRWNANPRLHGCSWLMVRRAAGRHSRGTSCACWSGCIRTSTAWPRRTSRPRKGSLSPRTCWRCTWPNR